MEVITERKLLMWFHDVAEENKGVCICVLIDWGPREGESFLLQCGSSSQSDSSSSSSRGLFLLPLNCSEKPPGKKLARTVT